MLLWVAQVLSQLASNMVLAALMATVVIATGSNTANAVLILTFLVPAVVFSAIAGVFVERSDARLIMLASNLLRAGGTVLFIFVGTHVGLILVINFFIATVTAFFMPAELTAIPRLVDRRNLMAANSVFVLTMNATFAIGFGFFGPLLLTTAGANTVYVVVAVMFGLAALAIIPLPAVRPERVATSPRRRRSMPCARCSTRCRRASRSCAATARIAWSLGYLGIAASLIGVMGAIGPGFATDILRAAAAGLLLRHGSRRPGRRDRHPVPERLRQGIPRRLVIDIGLVAMGVTLIGLALVKPITSAVAPALGTIESNLPDALAPLMSLIALVVLIAVTAGIEYAFVAIPSQTALQEELPVDVRGRIFGILNTLLSVASFLPVLVAPVAADLMNIVFPGAGIPVVMAVLGGLTLWIGIASWRHNAAAGLHGGGTHSEPRRGGRGCAVRLLAGAILVASALIAWLAISAGPAARLLQGAIGLSLVYVGYLACAAGRRCATPARATARGHARPAMGDGPGGGRRRGAGDRHGRRRPAGAGLRRWRSAPRFDVLVLDDGSSDGTGELARAAAAPAPEASGLRREPGAGPRTKAAVLAWAQPHVRGEVVGGDRRRCPPGGRLPVAGHGSVARGPRCGRHPGAAP